MFSNLLYIPLPFRHWRLFIFFLYLISFFIFFMRQHIYASNAMKNIYYHLFYIGQGKEKNMGGSGWKIVKCSISSLSCIFHYMKEKKYWICMLNAKNSLSGFLPFLWFVIYSNMSFAFCCFVPVLLPSLSYSLISWDY